MPGTVDGDKYILLIINHSITEQELALNYCLRAAVLKAWGADSLHLQVLRPVIHAGIGSSEVEPTSCCWPRSSR